MSLSVPPRVFALLGDPITHSLSPAMHNAGFRAAGINAVYIALAPGASAVADQIVTLCRNGGGNVTVPYKEIAAGAGFACDNRVAAIGAANVFYSVDGVPHLANTDVDGVLAAVGELSPPARPWLVLGTGGSARATVAAAVEQNAPVAIRSRSSERAAAFSVWANEIGATAALPEECGLIINTTPLGLNLNDPFPCDLEHFPADVCVLDLVYRRDGTTRWIADANARGHRGADGRGVLFAQGVSAWKYWLPGTPVPVEVMRAALDRPLERTLPAR